MRHLRLLAILFGLAVLAPFPAAGQSKTSNAGSAVQRSRDRKAGLEKDIALLSKQIKAVQEKSADAGAQLTLLRRQISSRKELVSRSDAEIALLQHRTDSVKAEMDRLQARSDTLSKYYARLVTSAYKNRDTRLWLLFILSSRDLGQASGRYSYLQNLSRQMSAQGRKVREARASLDSLKAGMDTLMAAAVRVRQERLEAVEALGRDEAEAASLVSRLKKDKKKYQQQLAAKRSQAAALDREIERLLSQGKTKSPKGGKSGSKTTSTQVDTKLAGRFESNKGKLPWPVKGVVVGHYGQHYHPVYSDVKLPFSNGVTIAVEPGAQVQAVFDGVVKGTVVVQGFNKCVLVQHGNYYTFYLKLKDVKVKTGQKLSTGQVIGTVDTISGETQMQFQVWKDRDKLDPEEWLK